MNEVPLLGGRGGKWLAGQAESSQERFTGLAKQERGNHRGNQPQSDLAEGEGRVRHCNGNVTDCDQPDSASESCPMDSPDHGAGTFIDGTEHLPQLLSILLRLRSRHSAIRPHPVEVYTSAKRRTSAGQNDYLYRGVPTQLVERLAQFSDHAGIKRVPPVRPIQRHTG